MALRYGGEVSTRSAVSFAIGSARASPIWIRALGIPEGSTKGSLAAMDLNLRSHADNGSCTGLLAHLCGRDRARSSAKEAPTDFAMIRLENTTQARSCSGPAGSLAIAAANAKSCF